MAERIDATTTLTLTVHFSGMPEGVTADHISEYLAAFIENRDPRLSESHLDAMGDIQGKVIEAVAS
jgi:hypothetical protein